jgi:hypothetical protein
MTFALDASLIEKKRHCSRCIISSTAAANVFFLLQLDARSYQPQQFPKYGGKMRKRLRQWHWKPNQR